MANCVNCGAPMHAGSDGILACAHCGSTGEGKVLYDVETIGASSASCPQCGTTLDDARIEECPVRACPSCRGLLVGMESFASLCDAVRARSFHTGPSFRDGSNRAIVCCHARSASSRCRVTSLAGLATSSSTPASAAR